MKTAREPSVLDLISCLFFHLLIKRLNYEPCKYNSFINPFSWTITAFCRKMFNANDRSVT